MELGGVDHSTLYKMDFYEYYLHLKSIKDRDSSTKSNELIQVDRFTKDSGFVDAESL